jgi:hypothetical protein
LDDLQDRLKKSNLKLNGLKERIEKRTSLLNEIDNEIKKRREYSLRLTESDKILRTRLLRNTEMKSALQNLADIAGYKLNEAEKEKYYGDLSFNNDNNNNIKLENNMNENENLTYALVKRLIPNENKLNRIINNSGSYTRYIEMAYSEVESILAKDKQTLIDLIRKLRTNDVKLKELEKLKVNVNSSLNRLNEYNANLINIINRDKQIETTVKQLESQIKLNSIKNNSPNNFSNKITTK